MTKIASIPVKKSIEAKSYFKGIESYQELYKRSVRDPEGFWQLRYRDSLGHTALSVKTWGSELHALQGAESFCEMAFDRFGD